MGGSVGKPTQEYLKGVMLHDVTSQIYKGSPRSRGDVATLITHFDKKYTDSEYQIKGISREDLQKGIKVESVAVKLVKNTHHVQMRLDLILEKLTDSDSQQNVDKKKAKYASPLKKVSWVSLILSGEALKAATFNTEDSTIRLRHPEGGPSATIDFVLGAYDKFKQKDLCLTSAETESFAEQAAYFGAMKGLPVKKKGKRKEKFLSSREHLKSYSGQAITTPKEWIARANRINSTELSPAELAYMRTRYHQLRLEELVGGKGLKRVDEHDHDTDEKEAPQEKTPLQLAFEKMQKKMAATAKMKDRLKKSETHRVSKNTKRKAGNPERLIQGTERAPERSDQPIPAKEKETLTNQEAADMYLR